MQRTVGIDAIGVYIPRLYIDLTDEWARVRAPSLSDGNVEKLVGKVREGVGVTRMAVPDAHEDCATLAALAAKRAIDSAGIDPRDIDTLAIGTETTVDQSKSIAAYVLGMLERHYGVSLAHVGAPQVQFACIGATYALEAIASRIRAGDNTRRYGLVVASDVSKYPLGTPGEYTQGAGAVALLVGDSPRVLALEPGLTGTVTRDERDFFRPNWSATAVVDGKYSVDVYLDCVEAAYAAYAERLRAQLGGRSGDLLDAVEALLFHVPFPRMAEYAAARLVSAGWLGDPEGRARLASEVPLVLAGPQGDARAWRRDVDRAFAKTQTFRSLFGQKVRPSLAFAEGVGNMYSGSLYLALACLLEQSRGAPLAGQRLLFASYGSGASAKVYSGVVAESCASATATLDVAGDLRAESEGGRRVALSVADYERLHGLADCELECDAGVAQKVRDGLALSGSEVALLRAALTKPSFRVRPRGASVRPPSAEFALEALGTSRSGARTDEGYRYYKWVS